MAKISELIKILKGEGNVAAVRRAERIGDEAPYAAERIDADTLRSALSRGDNAASLAIIKPEDFRYLAQQLPQNYLNSESFTTFFKPLPAGMLTKEYIRHLGGVAQQQGFEDIPFLEYGEYDLGPELGVKGHEGRHRMRALEGLGDEKALVRLFPEGKVREPLPRRSRSEFLDALAEKYGVPLRLLPEDFKHRDPFDAEGNEIEDFTRTVQPFQAGGIAKFFSAVDEAVANLRQKKGSGEQMLKQIQQSPSVKKEELDLRKLPEKLAGQQKVTQEDIQAMLKAVPAPKVKLTQRGGKGLRPTPPDLYEWVAESPRDRGSIIERLENRGYDIMQDPEDPQTIGFIAPDGDIVGMDEIKSLLETEREMALNERVEASRAYSAAAENLKKMRTADGEVKPEFRDQIAEATVTRENFAAAELAARERNQEINATRRELEQFMTDWQNTVTWPAQTDAPKFENFTTKGPKENYRELLIQLERPPRKKIERPPFEYNRQGLGGDPVEVSPEEAVTRLGLTDIDEVGYDAESVLFYPSGSYIVKRTDGGYYSQAFGEEIIKKDLDKVERWLATRLEGDLRRGDVYEPQPKAFIKSDHFPEEDILVHARVDDRVGPNGEKILYVEEIQSDWHQEARKLKLAEAAKVVDKGSVQDEIAEAARAQVRKELGLPEDMSIPPPQETPAITRRFKEVFEELEDKRIAEEARKLPKDFGYEKMGTRTPAFSQTSHELAVKQILDTAANEGYDKVMFSPGSEQVKRYSLGEYFDEVSVVPEDDGYVVRGVAKDGRVSKKTVTTRKQLAEVIGDDKTKQVLEQLEASADPATGVTLSGEDLIMGGKKAQGKLKIYDEIIPGFAAKYAGKEFNVQPGRTAVPVEDIKQLRSDFQYSELEKKKAELRRRFEEGDIDGAIDADLRGELYGEALRQVQDPFTFRDRYAPDFLDRFAPRDESTGKIDFAKLGEILEESSFDPEFDRAIVPRDPVFVPEKIKFKDPVKQEEFAEWLDDAITELSTGPRFIEKTLGPKFAELARKEIDLLGEAIYADMPPLKTVEGASIDITPEMREKIKTRGQPLFAVPPAVGATAVLTDEEEPVESYQAGGKVEERNFQKWIRTTPWFQEYVKEYGEEPNLDIEEYDYRAAWKAGVVPERDSYDKNRYHWPSVTPEGKPLKSEDHPTAWKEKYMQEFGVNPDAIGAEKPTGYKEAGRVEKKKGMQQEQFDSPFDESRRIGPKPGVSKGPASIRSLTKILRGDDTEAKNLERQRIAGNVAAGRDLGEYMYDMVVPQTPWELAAEAAFFPVPRPVRKGLLAAAGAMYDPEAEAAKLSLLHGSPSKITRLQPGRDLWTTTDPDYALKRAMDKMRIAEGAKGPGMVNRFEIEDTDLMRLVDKYSPEDIAIARKAFSKLPEGREMTGEEIYEIASTNTGGAKTAALEGVTRALGKKGYQVPAGATDKGDWYRVLDQTDLTIGQKAGGKITVNKERRKK